MKSLWIAVCVMLSAQTLITTDVDPVLSLSGKGMTLVADGKVWTMTSVKTVSVIYKIIPPEYNLTFHTCNMSYNPYLDVLKEFYKLANDTSPTRLKRFLSIAGLLTGLTGTVLGVKNWVSIQTIEHELALLQQQQADVAIWTKQVSEKSNANVQVLNTLITNWNSFKRTTVDLIDQNRCKIQFLLNILPTVTINLAKFTKALNAIRHIIKNVLKPEDLKVLVRYEQIQRALAALRTTWTIPPQEDFYRVVEIVPGKINSRTLTFSFLMLIPIFDTTYMSTYFVMNTGYLDANSIYRQCDLHGIVVYHNRFILQLHADVCTRIESTFYCPPHATLIDPRMIYLNETISCPPGTKQVLPLVQFRHCWISVTTSTDNLFIAEEQNKIMSIKRITSKSGHSVFSCKNVSKIWTESLVLYQRYDVDIYDTTLLNPPVNTNSSHFSSVNLANLKPLDVIPTLTTSNIFNSHLLNSTGHLCINIVITIALCGIGISLKVLHHKIRRLKQDHYDLVRLHQLLVEQA
nr:MAG: putative glycoprotein [Usmuvirus newyorkense]